MKTITIESLKENYSTKHLRVSHLEEFNKCQYLHKYWEVKDPTNKNLIFWTMVHNVCCTYMIDQKKWLELRNLYSQVDYESYDMIWKYLAILNQQRDNYPTIWIEFKWLLSVEFWDTLFIIEWTMDLICKVSDMYIIADLKTSKVERTDEIYEQKIQKYLYSIIFWEYFWYEKLLSFDYLILTKHKKPRLQIKSYKPDKQKLSEILKTILQNYKESLQYNIRETNKGNHCFSCPMKKLWCPSWSNNASEF